MSNWISKCLIATNLILLSFVSNAQRFLPAELSIDERQPFEIIGFTDKPYADAQFDFSGFERAKENLRRTGLLMRCAALVVLPDAYDFNSDLRETLRRIVRRQDDGREMLSELAKRMGVDPMARIDTFKIQNQATLWAWRVTSAQEKEKLVAYLQTSLGKQILQRFYAVNLLADYADHIEDASSGTKRAASPIILKAYFVQSGQVPLLESAITKELPSQLAAFRNIQTIDKHSAKDNTWLVSLSNALSERNIPLANAFMQSLPKVEQEQLNALLRNEFFTRRLEAQNAMSFMLSPALSAGAVIQNRTLLEKPFLNMRVGDIAHPDYLEFVSKLLAKDFPDNTKFKEMLWRAGPRDWIDNTHLQFCPEGDKK